MADESNGRRSVAGILEGIGEIQKTLMVEHVRLKSQVEQTAASAQIVAQQIEVLQSVLDAPFAQPGQKETATD